MYTYVKSLHSIINNENYKAIVKDMRFFTQNIMYENYLFLILGFHHSSDSMGQQINKGV